MAESAIDWGVLADLFGPEAYEPELAPNEALGDPLRLPDQSPDLHGIHAAEPAWTTGIQSSNVAEMIYWFNGGPDGATMGVRFLSGSEYHYWSVPHRLFLAILDRECNDHYENPSVGATHWQLIRRAGFAYRQIRPAGRGRWFKAKQKKR